MPWREMSPMEQRLEFIGEYATALFTMTELAAQYGISPKTGYKWLARYNAEGAVGLHDRSRRPHHHPQATPPELVDRLLALRRRYPRWARRSCSRSRRARIRGRAWPSRSTVCDHLKAHGLTAPRGGRVRRAPRPAPLAPVRAANSTWTTDFKGPFRTGDGLCCHPFTLRDAFSRYALRCDALGGSTLEMTRRCFARAFAESGLPERIRSDNGAPFAGVGIAGLSRLAVWWLRLAIVPERIAPGHPEQNGSHEQFHAVLKAATARPPAATRHRQQRRFDRFRAEYNHDRPHEALDNRVPAAVYQPSPRPLPPRLPPLEYPGHFHVRQVYSNGCVAWHGHLFYLSDAFFGEAVAFEEVDEGLWTVHFATLALGRYDERHRAFQPLCSQGAAGRSASGAGSAPHLKEQKDR